MGPLGPNEWMSPWLMAFALSGTLLMWTVVVLVITRILRHPVRGEPDAPAPLVALDERLARGEITIAQYRARRRRLVDGH